jgi:PPOX class probable F420-dependent enzyme
MEPAPTLTTAHLARLTDRIRAFLDRPLFLTLATIDPDGTPRQAVIWYRLEADGRILVNSRIGRRWPTNLLRDGRVSLAVADPDGYSWVGLTGRVDEVVDEHDAALADILALADRYHPEGADPADLASYRAYPRITFRIAIEGVHDHLED